MQQHTEEDDEVEEEEEDDDEVNNLYDAFTARYRELENAENIIMQEGEELSENFITLIHNFCENQEADQADLEQFVYTEVSHMLLGYAENKYSDFSQIPDEMAKIYNELECSDEMVAKEYTQLRDSMENIVSLARESLRYGLEVVDEHVHLSSIACLKQALQTSALADNSLIELEDLKDAFAEKARASRSEAPRPR